MQLAHAQSLPEILRPDKRLGRHIAHDDRSRSFEIESPVSVPVSIRWNRQAPVFDQGALGSCTGNAMAGVLGTDAKNRSGMASADEALAVELYSKATRLDRFKGEYPPYDTGSSGLAVCKAAKSMGLISGYRWSFTLKGALRALQNGPILVGIGWLTGCDSPDSDGLVQYKGYMRGGHEIMALGLDLSTNLVEFVNSWGPNWGKDGHFFMSVDDFGTALRQGGDVKQPVY